MTELEQARAIVRASRRLRPRRRRRLPRQQPPRGVEREYAAALLRIVAMVRAELDELLREVPALLASARRDLHRDAGEGKRIRQVTARAAERVAARLNTQAIEDLAERYANRTAGYQRTQLERQVRAGLGADVFISDRGVRPVVEGFVTENVALISDLPKKMIADVEMTITRAVASGKSQADLAKELEIRFDLTANRAKTIARDQINKLAGQVNAARQRELGIDKFTWRTVGDDRVRDAHERIEGKVYRFSKGGHPQEGLPGEPINCRCWAEPVFADLDDS